MRIFFIVTGLLFCVGNVFAQAAHDNLEITRLTGDFYIYTTYNLYKGEKIPANGMYLVTEKGVVLFDTPWDSTQFQPLLDSILVKHHQPVVICIATHFHDDRTAGLAYYRKQGIRTYTSVLTDQFSKKNDKKRAEFLIARDTVFRIAQYAFETFYPGPGHTADNIVCWFKEQHILYGACLIKAAGDTDLGYLGDADTLQYAATVKKVQQHCQQPRYVIPGHGDWTNIASLEHTRMMAEALKKRAGH